MDKECLALSAHRSAEKTQEILLRYVYLLKL